MENIKLENKIFNISNPLEKDKVLIIFLYLFWIGQLFATVDLGSPNLRLHKIFNPIRDFYNTQINHFPGFEFISILLMLVILLKFINFYTLCNNPL